MPWPDSLWFLEIDLDPEKCRYEEKFKGLISFFKKINVSDYPEIKNYAEKYKIYMLRLDPVIEYFTSKVCPYCGTVCCRQKFALPNKEDMITFWALDIDIPNYDFKKDINSSCQFLSHTGCNLPRLYRPFRCTWYFCDALWLQIEINLSNFNIETGLKQLRSARDKLVSNFIKLIST